MEDNITDIKDFKNNKKIDHYINDLKVIINIYNLSISSLKFFKHYQSVMEVISVLQNNKTLCEVYLNKLEKKKNGKMVKISKNDPGPGSA